MAQQCFSKLGSNPPLCGLHHVLLVQRRFPDEILPSIYEHLTFLMCSESGEVLKDGAIRL
jgi:hypothetical protein